MVAFVPQGSSPHRPAHMDLDQAITYRASANTDRASPLRLSERPNPRHTWRASASAPTAERPEDRLLAGLAWLLGPP